MLEREQEVYEAAMGGPDCRDWNAPYFEWREWYLVAGQVPDPIRSKKTDNKKGANWLPFFRQGAKRGREQPLRKYVKKFTIFYGFFATTGL